MSSKSKAKTQWKLVTEFPIRNYQCGAAAGDKVRLKRELIVRDHRMRPTGKVYSAGEIWTVVRGAAEKPRVLWLHEPDGTSHTWSDDEEFWAWFERLTLDH